jgi:hypothetical protein
VVAWQDSGGALWLVRGTRPPQILLREGADVYNEGVGFWSWAPSGHLLVSNVGSRVLVVDARTGHRTDVTPVSDCAAKYLEPLWSPAGDLVEYTRQTPKGAGCDSVDVGVARADGGRFQPVVNLFEPTAEDKKEAASGGLGCGGGTLEEALVNTAFIRWSSDGRALVVPQRGSDTGKPLRTVKVNSAGPTVGARIMDELKRRVGAA